MRITDRIFEIADKLRLKPVIFIIDMEGIPALNILVAPLRRAVWGHKNKMEVIKYQ